MNITIILIILLAGAFITFFSGDRLAPKVAMFFSIVAAAFSVVLLLDYQAVGVTNYSLDWVSNPKMTFSLKLDGLSVLLVMLNCILLPLIISTSIANKTQFSKLLYSLILFMAFAMTGVFVSSDALLYYVFWELSLIPIYFIIVLWGNGDRSKRRSAAMTFFVYTFGGSLFMLASIIYLYIKTGTFQIDAFYNADLTINEQIWLFLGFFLAYAIKIPIVPFHTWQANVYQKAPAVGSMLLAALMSKMGVYSVLRWQLPITGDAAHLLQPYVLGLCVFGVLYGSLLALKQDNIKRFFAYASLAHVGFIAAGAYALTYDGLQGAVVLTIAHAFGITGLFFVSEVIFRRTGSALISQLGGIKTLAPNFTIIFCLLMLASITIPLSFNFVGEFMVMYGLYQINIWYAVLVGTSMFLGAFYMMRMYQQVMLGDKTGFSFADVSLSEGVVFTILIAVLLIFGLFPTPISEIVAPSLKEILIHINR